MTLHKRRYYSLCLRWYEAALYNGMIPAHAALFSLPMYWELAPSSRATE